VGKRKGLPIITRRGKDVRRVPERKYNRIKYEKPWIEKLKGSNFHDAADKGSGRVQRGGQIQNFKEVKSSVIQGGWGGEGVPKGSDATSEYHFEIANR